MTAHWAAGYHADGTWSAVCTSGRFFGSRITITEKAVIWVEWVNGLEVRFSVTPREVTT